MQLEEGKNFPGSDAGPGLGHGTSLDRGDCASAPGDARLVVIGRAPHSHDQSASFCRRLFD